MKAKPSKRIRRKTMTKKLAFFDKKKNPVILAVQIPVREPHPDPMYLAPLFD